MSQETLHLQSGRCLQKRRDAWVLQPDARTVLVTFDGDAVAMTDPDTNNTVNDRIGTAVKKKTAKSSSASTSKWHTYNDFVDTVSPQLDPVESLVWFHIFRRTDASTGMAKMALAALAERTGRSERTVIRAVDKLLRLGVLERVVRGSRQGGGSVYKLADRPSSVVAGKLTRRRGAIRPTRASAHDARDEKGRYSKDAMGVGS